MAVKPIQGQWEHLCPILAEEFSYEQLEAGRRLFFAGATSAYLMMREDKGGRVAELIKRELIELKEMMEKEIA